VAGNLLYASTLRYELRKYYLPTVGANATEDFDYAYGVRALFNGVPAGGGAMCNYTD
jgi:hypothetical protein